MSLVLFIHPLPMCVRQTGKTRPLTPISRRLNISNDREAYPAKQRGLLWYCQESVVGCGCRREQIGWPESFSTVDTRANTVQTANTCTNILHELCSTVVRCPLSIWSDHIVTDVFVKDKLFCGI